MKHFLTLMFFYLCLTHSFAHASELLDGRYVFEKAELVITNNQTKAILEHKVYTNIDSIKINKNIHLLNIFIEVNLRDGKIVETIMLDDQKYKVDGEILYPTIEKKDEELISQEEKGKYLYTRKNIQPHEQIVEGNNLLIDYLQYAFGQTDIDFTMEAKLKVTMIKQKIE